MPGREEEHQGGVSRRLVNERVFQRGILGWRGEATLGGRVSAGFRFFVLIIIHTHTHTQSMYLFSFVRSFHPSIPQRVARTQQQRVDRNDSSTRPARARVFVYTREISQKNTRRRRPIVNRRFKDGSRNRLYDRCFWEFCMYKQNVVWVYKYLYTTLLDVVCDDSDVDKSFIG